MEEEINIKNAESENLIKSYEKIDTFIKFLDSEYKNNNMEEKDG